MKAVVTPNSAATTPPMKAPMASMVLPRETVQRIGGDQVLRSDDIGQDGPFCRGEQRAQGELDGR